MLFSQRNNLFNDSLTFQRFKTRTWNTFGNLLGVFHGQCNKTMNLNVCEANFHVLCYVADRLGLDITTGTIYTVHNSLREYVSNATSIEYVFDLIEAHLKVLHQPVIFPVGVVGINIVAVQTIATNTYRQILLEENLPYQLYNGNIVPLIAGSELAEIEKAAMTDYESVNRHIEKAWTYFSDRKSPDYENSIKESISAVEAMCCIINGKDKTLNKALERLKNSGVHIHPSLEKGFISLYAYTCDEKGIRHAGRDFVDASADDARYMLISCAAFVNYLIEKWKKCDIKEE